MQDDETFFPVALPWDSKQNNKGHHAVDFQFYTLESDDGMIRMMCEFRDLPITVSSMYYFLSWSGHLWFFCLIRVIPGTYVFIINAVFIQINKKKHYYINSRNWGCSGFQSFLVTTNELVLLLVKSPIELLLILPLENPRNPALPGRLVSIEGKWVCTSVRSSWFIRVQLSVQFLRLRSNCIFLSWNGGSPRKKNQLSMKKAKWQHYLGKKAHSGNSGTWLEVS